MCTTSQIIYCIAVTQVPFPYSAPNPCGDDNGGCQYLCLLSATTPEMFSCFCPQGLPNANENCMPLVFQHAFLHICCQLELQAQTLNLMPQVSALCLRGTLTPIKKARDPWKCVLMPPVSTLLQRLSCKWLEGVQQVRVVACVQPHCNVYSAIIFIECQYESRG